MKHIRPLLLPLFLLIFVLLWPGPAAAQEDDSGDEDTTPGIEMDVTTGMDQYYKENQWVPVQITVANNGPALEGVLRIHLGTDENGQTYTAPISLPTQSNKRLTMYVMLTTFTSRLAVQLLDEDGEQVARALSPTLIRLSNSDLLYGVISSNGGELGFLEDVTGGRAAAKVALLDLDALPDAAAGWDMLDILIIHDTDISQLAAAQREALDAWLSLGGQLVVAGGTGWQKTITPLADYLPVTVTGSESREDLPGLRTRIGLPFRDPGPYVLTTSTLRSGELILHEDGLPLLARRDWGRGRVYFLALDPTLAPLTDWDGSPLLWEEVAGAVPRFPFWASGFSNTYAASEAVKNIPTLALPSAILLLCFMGVYVLLIGPVNYLVLKRLKRREWAWITIPAAIVFFTGCAYLTGFGLKGNNLILHQMNVAYGQANSPGLRVNSLVALYSPRRATYDFILPGDAMALPFTGAFGGVGNVALGNVAAVERGTDLVMRDVRVDVSDSETFMVESYRAAPEISSQVSLSVSNGRFQLDVMVRNESEVTLENAVLMYGSTVYGIGTLEPGQEATWKRNITATEAAAASGTTFSYGGYTSPLLDHNLEILGTTSPYNDPVAYSRRQLLEAMHQDLYYGGSGSYLIPRGVVTLIGWTDEPLLDLSVDSRRGQEHIASTLYFLELPITEMQISGRDITVPQSMLSWEVLENNGQYGGIGIEDFSLYNGSITYEFQPTPELGDLQVHTLKLNITRQTYSSSILPAVTVWNWQTETWDQLNLTSWGLITISEPANFIGPGNRVRFQLENNQSVSIDINTFYPVFTGDLE